MKASGKKAKGRRLENLINQIAEEHGMEGERAWGSDGRSLGWESGVDNVIRVNDLIDLKIQAKSKARVAKYLYPPEGADVTVVHEIRRGFTGEPLAVLPLKLLLELIR